MVYLIVLYRVITVLLVFLIVALLLNKRHLGRYTIFDFITAVTMGSVAGTDMADLQVSHGLTLFALIVIGIAHILFTEMLIRNRKLGKLVTFDPTMIIQNGKIVVKNLKKVRYTLDDLISHLRENGVFDIGEVEFAILEPNGKLSCLKKSRYLNVTLEDLDISTQYKGVSIPLIIEGKVDHTKLDSVMLTEKWLFDELKKQGVKDVQEVFFAVLNTEGDLYVSKYQDTAYIQKIDH